MTAKKPRNRTQRRRAERRQESKTALSKREIASGNNEATTTRHPQLSSSAQDTAFLSALPALALCLLIAVSYFPVTLAGFVWDDVAIQKLLPLQNLSGIWQIWFDPASLKQHEGHYWPLLYTTFWLEHKLWGVAPAGYHIVNLLLHTTVTLLLWRLLLRIEVAGAWFAAAVFAVHPLHVEPVAWIIGRKDLMATLFFLAAALHYMRFVHGGRHGHYFGALALFAAGLLCKSIIVTLPVSLLIWHWWKQNRVTVADITRVLPFFLLGIFVTIADWLFYTGNESISLDYSLIERALIAAQALWFYASKLVWPAGLAGIYPLWDISVADPLDWACLVAAVALAALLWFYRSLIGRGPLAGALFFTASLLPVLGFVDYGHMQFSFVADRYQYLAGIGLIAVLTGAAAHGVRSLTGASGVGVSGVALLVLVVLGTLTWNQAGIYRDDGTFFRHVVAANPRAKGAYFNLGLWSQEQGRGQEAEKQYRRALQINPRDKGAMLNLALLLTKQQRYEEGLEQYQDILKIDSKYTGAYTGMGAALEALHRYEEALSAYRTALDQRPDHVWPHLHIGFLTDDMGRLEESETHLRHVLRLHPDLPEALYRLGAVRIKQQRYPEALELFQTLVKESPGVATFYSDLGVALANLNRHEEALQNFERALELDPSLETARTNRDHVLQALKSKDTDNQRDRQKNQE